MTRDEITGLIKGLKYQLGQMHKWQDMLSSEMKTTQADSYLKALEELLDYKAIYGDNPRKSVPRSK